MWEGSRLSLSPPPITDPCLNLLAGNGVLWCNLWLFLKLIDLAKFGYG